MSELKHYGVKGMKWGVRRTERNAYKLLRKHAKINSYNADRYNKHASIQRNKGNIEAYKRYKALGEDYAKKSKRCNDYLSKIETGKVTAGKNYIVDTKVGLEVNWRGVGISRTKTLKTDAGFDIIDKFTLY